MEGSKLAGAWDNQLNLLSVFDLDHQDYYLPPEDFYLPVYDPVHVAQVEAEDKRFQRAVENNYQTLQHLLSETSLSELPKDLQKKGTQLFDEVFASYEGLIDNGNYRIWQDTEKDCYTSFILKYMKRLQDHRHRSRPPAFLKPLGEFLITKKVFERYFDLLTIENTALKEQLLQGVDEIDRLKDEIKSLQGEFLQQEIDLQSYQNAPTRIEAAPSKAVDDKDDLLSAYQRLGSPDEIIEMCVKLDQLKAAVQVQEIGASTIQEQAVLVRSGQDRKAMELLRPALTRYETNVEAIRKVLSG